MSFKKDEVRREIFKVKFGIEDLKNFNFFDDQKIINEAGLF